MTNYMKFPMNADDARIAAREDEYANRCDAIDAELRFIAECARLAQILADTIAEGK